MGDDIKVVGLTFLVAIIGIALLAVGFSNNEPEKVERTQTTAVQRYQSASSDQMGYAYEQAYIEGCTDGTGVSYQDCKCMYDFLDTTLTNAEFEELSLYVLRTGESTDEILDAVWACI